MNIIDPHDYYLMPLEDRERVIKVLKEQVRRSNNPLIKAMYNIVKRYLKHYELDFYLHDLYGLTLLEYNEYIWIVRKSGTHLLSLDCFSKEQAKDRKEHLDTVLKVFKNIKGIYLINREKQTLRRINNTNEIKFYVKEGLSDEKMVY